MVTGRSSTGRPEEIGLIRHTKNPVGNPAGFLYYPDPELEIFQRIMESQYINIIYKIRNIHGAGRIFMSKFGKM
jgi:hypothetical protein